MALDGIFLHFLKDEIISEILGARVDKVFQPSKDEIILAFRTREGVKKLLLSARANSPRIHFIQKTPENPQQPPMLCMLLRKHLTGAVLKEVRQAELDRILFMDFEATNEIGDRVDLSVCIEIMSKHSNVILMYKDGKIIDSLKRVDITKSSFRQVLPGLQYQFPPAQQKICLLNADVSDVLTAVQSFPEKRMSAALLSVLQGVSPIVCRDIAKNCDNSSVVDLTASQLDDVRNSLAKLQQRVINGSPEPTIILDSDNKPRDFSFMEIEQYGDSASSQKFETCSLLLDSFYDERDRIERTHQRAQDLFRLLHNTIERISRKINVQKAELNECANRETLRIYAELIQANQYQLQKGSFYYDLYNYYDNNNVVRIKADPALTPSQNAQKYYKEYKKSRTAEEKLNELISSGEQELLYIESVLDLLTRSNTERELSEIRAELAEQGYLRSRQTRNKQKQQKALPPIEYRSTDGFTILVGRNNIQNDRLSLKLAHNYDMWLHVKNIPGSHVVVVSNGVQVSDLAVSQAAIIAAYHSRARDSSQVPVDFTYIKNLRKPQGAKPGKVIYNTYQTLTVNPQQDVVNKLFIK